MNKRAALGSYPSTVNVDVRSLGFQSAFNELMTHFRNFKTAIGESYDAIPVNEQFAYVSFMSDCLFQVIRNDAPSSGVLLSDNLKSLYDFLSDYKETIVDNVVLRAELKILKHIVSSLKSDVSAFRAIGHAIRLIDADETGRYAVHLSSGEIDVSDWLTPVLLLKAFSQVEGGSDKNITSIRDTINVTGYYSNHNWACHYGVLSSLVKIIAKIDNVDTRMNMIRKGGLDLSFLMGLQNDRYNSMFSSKTQKNARDYKILRQVHFIAFCMLKYADVVLAQELFNSSEGLPSYVQRELSGQMRDPLSQDDLTALVSMVHDVLCAPDSPEEVSESKLDDDHQEQISERELIRTLFTSLSLTAHQVVEQADAKVSASTSENTDGTAEDGHAIVSGDLQQTGSNGQHEEDKQEQDLNNAYTSGSESGDVEPTLGALDLPSSERVVDHVDTEDSPDSHSDSAFTSVSIEEPHSASAAAENVQSSDLNTTSGTESESVQDQVAQQQEQNVSLANESDDAVSVSSQASTETSGELNSGDNSEPKADLSTATNNNNLSGQAEVKGLAESLNQAPQTFVEEDSVADYQSGDEVDDAASTSGADEVKGISTAAPSVQDSSSSERVVDHVDTEDSPDSHSDSAFTSVSIEEPHSASVAAENVQSPDLNTTSGTESESVQDEVAQQQEQNVSLANESDDAVSVSSQASTETSGELNSGDISEPKADLSTATNNNNLSGQAEVKGLAESLNQAPQTFVEEDSVADYQNGDEVDDAASTSGAGEAKGISTAAPSVNVVQLPQYSTSYSAVRDIRSFHQKIIDGDLTEETMQSMSNAMFFALDYFGYSLPPHSIEGAFVTRILAALDSSSSEVTYEVADDVAESKEERPVLAESKDDLAEAAESRETIRRAVGHIFELLILSKLIKAIDYQFSFDDAYLILATFIDQDLSEVENSRLLAFNFFLRAVLDGQLSLVDTGEGNITSVDILVNELFLKAVEVGHEQMIANLLISPDEAVDFNAYTSDPLHAQADINYQNAQGQTALMLAMDVASKASDLDVTERIVRIAVELMRFEPEVNLQDANDQAVIDYAVSLTVSMNEQLSSFPEGSAGESKESEPGTCLEEMVSLLATESLGLTLACISNSSNSDTINQAFRAAMLKGDVDLAVTLVENGATITNEDRKNIIDFYEAKGDTEDTSDVMDMLSNYYQIQTARTNAVSSRGLLSSAVPVTATANATVSDDQQADDSANLAGSELETDDNRSSSSPAIEVASVGASSVNEEDELAFNSLMG